MKRFISIIVAVMLVISSIPMTYAVSFYNNETVALTSQNNDYPVITSITTINGGHKITWDKFDDTSKYRLFYKVDSSLWKTLTITDGVSYNHTGLTNNKTYIYTVRAVDENGNFTSSCNKDGWAFTYLSSPVMKTLSSTTDGMKVTWNAVEGAENYKVYVKYSTGGWKALGYTTGTSFVDTNVTSGNTYTYTVRCVSADGKLFTSYNTSGIKGTYVATPQITKIENTANGTKITWNKVAGASKYKVFYKTETSWKTIATTSNSSYTHAPLKNQDTYTYTVRACNSSGSYISSYNSTGTKNTFLSVPVLKSTSSVFEGMKITWNHVQGAAKYKVYVKTATSWKALGTTTENSFIDKTATSGVSHTYTVRCVAENGSTWTSYFNTKGITGTFVASPKISKVENLSDSVKITWDSVAGASKYKVFYKTATSWKTITTTDTTSYTHTGLKNGDTYTYTVRACNASGSYISGYDSNGTYNKFIAPVKLTYSLSGTYPLISWNRESSVYAYRVYRKSIDGSWSKIIETTDTKFIDTTAPQNVPVTYTMRCINEDGQTISYYITDTKYYYKSNLANGTITYKNSTYNFDNGNLRQGFVTINSKLYYYSKDGKPLKNTIVGSESEGYYYADQNGVCCQSEEMVLAAEFIKKYSTGKTASERMKTGFNYLSRNYPYKRSYDHPKKASDMPQQAIDMFVDKKGNCFKYAAAFACIARASGYRARVVVGTTPSVGGYWTPHGWTEVYVDGKWLVCDPDFQMMYPSPAYFYYMTNGHKVPVKASAKYEITTQNGEAIWK